MHYASTAVFLGTGGLTSSICISGIGGVLSGMARKQLSWKGQKTDFSDLRRLGG